MAAAYTVLYVDDELTLLEISKIFLEQDGEFSVDTVSSAPAALALMQTKTYDAIISDYQMPEMDGIAFLKQVRGASNSIPFILFTGRGREEIVIQALNEGADFYLQKGGEPKSQFVELAHKIRSAVSRKKAEEELKCARDVLEERVKQRTADLYTTNLQLQKEIEIRKQIDAALHESEERFRTLIEKAPEAILLFDVDEDQYIEANARAEELFGCSRQQLLNFGPQQFYLPDQADGRPFRETVLEHRRQALEGAELVFERQIRNAAGKERVVEVRLVRLPSSTRKLIRSSYIDITERKKGEIALRESEKRYRAIVEQDYRSMFENIQDIFYRTDADGILILVTPSGARLLGYAGTEEMIGRPATDYYADPVQRERLLATLRKEGSVSNIETTLKRKDGSLVIVSTSSHVYYDTGGNYAGVEGIFRDITRFKRVQEELRQSEEQSRVLVSHIQDGAFLMQDGILIFCNDAFAAMIGYTPAMIMGTPVPPLIAPEDREMVMERQRGRLAGKSRLDSYEFRMLHKDQKTRIPVILSVGLGTYRNLPAVIGTVRDVTRERARERALQESERRFALFMEHLPAAVYIKDLDGGVLFTNRFLNELFGWSDTAGKSTFDLLPADIAQKMTDDDRKAVEQGMVSVVESITDIHGVQRYFSTTKFSIPNSTGTPLMGGISIDITERKLAEDALRESERQFRLITDNMVDMVAMFDPGARYVYVSPSYEKILGYRQEELIGRDATGFLHPEDRETAVQDISRMVVSGTGSAIFRFRHKDGTYRWIESTGSIITGPEGQITGSVLGSRDITGKKLAEEDVRKNEEKFRVTFDTAQSALIILEIGADGMPGRMIETNNAAYTQLGYTREELLAKSFPELDAAEYHDTIARHITGLSSMKSSSYESVRIRKDGTRFPVEVNIHRMTYDGREVIMSSARDITVRKRTEEMIRRANGKLSLLSTITRHDINNQLTVLRSYLAILEMKQDDPSFDAYIRKAKNAAESISAMIRFTREYESIGVHTPVWQNCRTLVETAAKQFVPGGVTVEDTLPAAAELFADPLIARVFYNLADNAVRHGGNVTTIRFFAEDRDGETVIVCEDDGSGVPAGDKEKIFERGFGKNTGLGLFLCREILSITGITIRETGEPGRGARFEMVVPKGAYNPAGRNAGAA